MEKFTEHKLSKDVASNQSERTLSRTLFRRITTLAESLGPRRTFTLLHPNGYLLPRERSDVREPDQLTYAHWLTENDENGVSSEAMVLIAGEGKMAVYGIKAQILLSAGNITLLNGQPTYDRSTYHAYRLEDDDSVRSLEPGAGPHDWHDTDLAGLTRLAKVLEYAEPLPDQVTET